MSVDVIVLSYNRWPALEATLRALEASPALAPSSGDGRRGARTITVVDNASTDSTPQRVEEFFPRVRLVKLTENIGVEAFDRAVHESVADAILILDDDAIPDPDALRVAIDRLATDASLAAVTFHPVHPRTGLSEWRFASAGVGGRSDWSAMGCCNLIRRSDWNQAGGYEKAYFLYRNDADLALSLLAMGKGVFFDPALIARHDSPAGAGGKKSLRWHELATRNWIFMCKRHGGAWYAGSALPGVLLGWAWAHRLSGLSIGRHRATLRGALRGLVTPAPPLPGPVPDGSHLGRLIRLLVTHRAPGGTGRAPRGTGR